MGRIHYLGLCNNSQICKYTIHVIID